MACRLITGRTLGKPGKASATQIDSASERSFVFLFPDPECVQHSPYHPSSADSAVEPLSDAEHFAVEVEPNFVRSTASASEILTNVAIQDMFDADDLGFYELSCHPRNSSTLSSAPEPSGLFDFVYPLASSGRSNSNLELADESPRRSPEVSPEVSPDPYDWNETGCLRPVKTRRRISLTSVEVTFSSYPDSLPGEHNADDEEVIAIPVIPVLSRKSSSFPLRPLLSTILEEDEDEDEDGHSSYEDEDETSSVETVRPTNISARARPDTGFVWTSDGVEHLCESNPCVEADRRMSF